MRYLISLILALGLCAGLSAQETKGKTPEKPKTETPKKVAKNPMLLMHTNMGDITIEVFEKETPIHAKNFMDRVDKGLYDSLIFHRVIPNFVIQGGDPTGTGYGKPDEGRLADEKSPYSNTRGYISMARSQAGASPSQFFINLGDNSRLDAQNFSVFAKVVEGMDIADQISKVKTTSDKPNTPVIMLKVSRKK
jgi:cyclophilin family peptidyl-prolyl cis-trans isomerase